MPHRPGASVLGQDAYPDVLTKAAALAVAAGRIDDVADVAAVLGTFVANR